ncbi:hypothetical protein [Pararhodobacter aggregans]|nr:hypothetical protein [Pararhodobacter aggregans]
MLSRTRIRRAAPLAPERRVMPEGCRECENRLFGLCPSWPQGRW